MDSGVHIGLAAWLYHRADREGFLAWPGAPLAMRLARLEGAESPEDMARIAEFSRMVNFVARPGVAARPGGGVPLWEVHADILRRMDFAARAWTEAEHGAFLEARATLYGDEGMTPLYLLYKEFRTAHQDLLAAGAPADVLREAMVAWELEGGKSEIEAALATVERLMGRSTLSRAQAERDGLMMLPVDPSGADYALTGFSPISVLDISGWVSASAAVADLDGAVARAPQDLTGTWRAWRQGKSGSVNFRFAIMLIDRDWFSPALYAADDWTLPGGAMVADGQGGGALPGYPLRVYLVRDVSYKPGEAKPPASVRPELRPAKPSHILLQDPPRVAAAAALKPRTPLSVAQPKGLSAAKPAALSARTTTETLTARPAVASQFTAARLPAASRITLTAEPVARLRPGTIQLVDNLTIRRRFAVAHQIVTRMPQADSPPPDPTLWAVGFGCEALPKAPNPHPGYGWT